MVHCPGIPFLLLRNAHRCARLETIPTCARHIRRGLTHRARSHRPRTLRGRFLAASTQNAHEGRFAFYLLRGRDDIGQEHFYSPSLAKNFSALILLPILLNGSQQNLASPGAAVSRTAAPSQQKNRLAAVSLLQK